MTEQTQQDTAHTSTHNAGDMDGVLQRAQCLFTQAKIAQGVTRLAEQMNADLSSPQHVLCVLTGSVVFTGHLLTHLTMPVTLDYVHATRYRGEIAGAEKVQWLALPAADMTNAEVLIVDDIYDEGVTLEAVIALCYQRGAKIVRTVMLLNKAHQRKAMPHREIDYCVFTVPDVYVFGYGMDYKNQARNLPSIYAAAREDY